MISDDTENMIDGYLAGRPSDQIIRQLKPSVLTRGTNPKWRAVATDGTAYIVKVSKNNYERVPEINEREALTSLLGRLVGVPVVDAWVVPVSLLTGLILPVWDKPEAPLIRDRCVLMPFLDGVTVADVPDAAVAQIRDNPTG